MPSGGGPVNCPADFALAAAGGRVWPDSVVGTGAYCGAAFPGCTVQAGKPAPQLLCGPQNLATPRRPGWPLRLVDLNFKL